jgi:hypothetical protein
MENNSAEARLREQPWPLAESMSRRRTRMEMLATAL